MTICVKVSITDENGVLLDSFTLTRIDAVQRLLPTTIQENENVLAAEVRDKLEMHYEIEDK